MNARTLTGQRFGTRTVLERGPNLKRGNSDRTQWVVECDCGRVDLVAQPERTQTCPSCLNKTHGQRYSLGYNSWISMRQRCLNPNNKDHPHYGGAGITISPRWDNFEAFLEDMGERPTGTSLDRIDPYGNYEPGNCRWASIEEQRNNRRK